MTRRVLFVIDPFETIKVHHDTTYAILLETARRSDATFVAECRDLFFRNELRVNARPVAPRRGASDSPTPGPPENRAAADFNIIWMRKDPPVDLEYLYATQLLSLAPSSTVVLNHPRALRDANEKLYALRFPSLIPETLVTSSIDEIDRFRTEVGGAIVVKPLDGMGGRGVYLVRDGDPNRRALLETATGRGTQTVVAQRYLPAVAKGDKRILLLGGEPIGALNRIPQVGDLRANMAAGGTVAPTVLDQFDLEICDALRDALIADGLHFVGIDVIGGHLTEVNVTSPTCLQEINRLNNVQLERRVVDYAESLSR
ncbi:MAG: glutathione synthase [Deltaproteobacteria bacterium]|nr:glutathione synthase [Deltaproteobacteria bacterium]